MMSETRVMPIGAQSFEVLRSNQCVYVDKTRYVYQLISQSRVYFLSRPRRFGKSLLLSTLDAYFSGKQELFKGLYLEQAELEFAAREKREAWQQYPVLYLDLNAERYAQPHDLENALNTHLVRWEQRYGKEASEATFSSRFMGVIRRAHEKTGRQVVVLIDEYDKPLLDTLDKSELNGTYRDILRAFFSVIKSSDRYLRFAFLTGVTRFSKVSVFSGLNNLRDISLLSDFAGICGITEQELEANFAPEIETLGNELGETRDATLAILKKRYDGYLFARKGENVYNPFSLLNVFASRELSDYWYATGTPTFLVEYLKAAHYNIPDLEGNVRLDESDLEANRTDSRNPLPILFQAGYLTIKEYQAMFNVYRLGFPNDEVRYGFMKNLLDGFAPTLYGAGVAASDFARDMLEGKVDEFMTRMRSILSGIPYSTVSSEEMVALRERDYQVSVYLIFSLMGQFVQTEVHNSVGRADCVVHTRDVIYVFEFKLWSKGTPQEALAQIKANGYDTPFRASGKRVVLIGVSFDEQKRTIGAWEAE
ncbi:MAG: ATP-binding protein [Bacteroides sp.]